MEMQIRFCLSTPPDQEKALRQDRYFAAEWIVGKKGVHEFTDVMDEVIG